MDDQSKRQSSLIDIENDQDMENMEKMEDDKIDREIELKKRALREKLKVLQEKYLIVQKLKTYCQTFEDMNFGTSKY